MLRKFTMSAKFQGPLSLDHPTYLPPCTFPLVQIALKESVVITQTTPDSSIITEVSIIPACATIHAIRKNSITPQMLSRHGIKTPCEGSFT